MDNNITKKFDGIFDNLKRNALGAAIRSVRLLVAENPTLIYDEELEDIENNYRLMADFLKRGFKDPQRDEIYSSLAARLYRFTSDMYMAYKVQNVGFFSEAAGKSANKTFSEDMIKGELESFVTDVAMLSLEAEPERTSKSKAIYQRHYDFMQALFNHIITSGQTNEHEASFMTEILLSPATDSMDAQLLVSALMLAAMNNYDWNKFNILLNVYKKSTDEKIRQKALIGWVFSLSAKNAAHDKLRQAIVDTLREESVVKELAELQKQIIFCLNAEQDTDKIRRDIMPELIKNNNLNITRYGITEKEDDPMDDIFDPGASDRAMEKMEASFQKMMNMQKAGSDIYFGGFSQMKRFPFFYSVSNWFCPFYLEHPGISSTTSTLKDTPLLASILSNGPFCDSDKYSFTLALASVISRLPGNIKEMLNSPEALGQTVSDEDQRQPAYIRRMILQDLYRFFKLYPQRSQLVNPFAPEHFMFVTNSMMHDTEIRNVVPELCYFMIKHKNKEALKGLITTYDDGNDAKMLLAKSIYSLNFAKQPEMATKALERLRSIDPDNKKAQSLLARAYFECGKYELSAECYHTLYDREPGNSGIALNYCVALAKSERYDEAVNLLYKLDIEHPDSMPVIRVLAWTLMGLKRYEQAEKAYNRLLNSDDAETGDFLNAGYCKLLSGNTAGAISLFKDFAKGMGHGGGKYDISKDFTNDHGFLAKHGVSDIDIMIISDIVMNED